MCVCWCVCVCLPVCTHMCVCGAGVMSYVLWALGWKLEKIQRKKICLAKMCAKSHEISDVARKMCVTILFFNQETLEGKIIA